jgi:hypothetical protein
VQLVEADANASVGHVPLVPVQLSATSHCPADARQTVAFDLYTSTQLLLVPTQWSLASSSQNPPCELPVQLVEADANPSVGHVPLVPVQLSATSHCPAEPRHTVAFDL